MTNSKNTYRNKKDIDFKVKHIGMPFETNTPATYFEKHYRENMVISDYTEYEGDGCIYYGQAGCGKTTKLVEFF